MPRRAARAAHSGRPDAGGGGRGQHLDERHPVPIGRRVGQRLEPGLGLGVRPGVADEDVEVAAERVGQQQDLEVEADRHHGCDGRGADLYGLVEQGGRLGQPTLVPAADAERRQPGHADQRVVGLVGERVQPQRDGLGTGVVAERVVGRPLGPQQAGEDVGSPRALRQLLGPPQVRRVGHAGVAAARPLDRQQAADRQQLGLDVVVAAGRPAEAHGPVEHDLGRLERVAAHRHLGRPLERGGGPPPHADGRGGPEVLGQDLRGVVPVDRRWPRGRRRPARGCGRGATTTRRRPRPPARARARSGTCRGGRPRARGGGGRSPGRGRRAPTRRPGRRRARARPARPRARRRPPPAADGPWARAAAPCGGARRPARSTARRPRPTPRRATGRGRARPRPGAPARWRRTGCPRPDPGWRRRPRARCRARPRRRRAPRSGGGTGPAASPGGSTGPATAWRGPRRRRRCGPPRARARCRPAARAGRPARGRRT